MKSLVKQQGLTLIEILVTAVIIAIIAGIAYPSYQKSIQKSNRQDAKTALLEAAAMQERIYSESGSYVDNSALNRLVTNSDGKSSREGYYTLAVDVSECSSGPPFDCYAITATAAGTQANDTDCSTFTINHIGQKTAKSSSCW